MPIFERPPLDTLSPAKDRWTPIYLERGRIEVDFYDDKARRWNGAACPQQPWRSRGTITEELYHDELRMYAN